MVELNNNKDICFLQPLYNLKALRERLATDVMEQSASVLLLCLQKRSSVGSGSLPDGIQSVNTPLSEVAVEVERDVDAFSSGVRFIRSFHALFPLFRQTGIVKSSS